jgi:hypothetical protein
MTRATPQPDSSFEATQWTRLFCVREGEADAKIADLIAVVS